MMTAVKLVLLCKSEWRGMQQVTKHKDQARKNQKKIQWKVTKTYFNESFPTLKILWMTTRVQKDKIMYLSMGLNSEKIQHDEPNQIKKKFFLIKTWMPWWNHHFKNRTKDKVFNRGDNQETLSVIQKHE